jgi:ubiquitin-activating enzyme E1
MGSWKAAADKSEEAERLDRQKAAFGAETLAKMKDLNVFVIGMRGVGVETAKNMILSNVGSVTIWDPNHAELRDMGSNFYITEEHVSAGHTRADASLQELRSLNPYCKVEVYDGPLSDDLITQGDVLDSGKPFAAVVVTQMLPKSDMYRINTVARSHNIAFIMAFTSGVTASMFSDFGDKHIITDHDGKAKETLALAGIEVLDKPELLKINGVKDGEAVVVLSFASVAEHNVLPGDGSKVILDDLDGELAELNGHEFEIKRCSAQVPVAAELKTEGEEFGKLLTQSTTSQLLEGWTKMHESFEAAFEAAKKDEKDKFKTRTFVLMNRIMVITDKIDLFRKYSVGGLCTEVKQPVEHNHLSFETALTRIPSEQPGVPRMLNAEAGQEGQGIDTHVAFAAVLEFHDKEGRWPELHSEADANTFVDCAKELVAARVAAREGDDLCSNDTVVPRKLFYGFVADPEELRDLDESRLKRFSKMFLAELTGFCAYLGGMAAQEVVKKTGKFTPFNQWIHHEDQSLCTDECRTNMGPTVGTRYDDQISILGKDFCSRAANMQIFMVGCGALGCEYLKALALMGVGTAGRGRVVVTDMDTIEVSNLSRQFLFRPPDVTHSKSKTGARVVKGWNSDMNIEGIEKFVGPPSEDYFNDEFWGSLDLCWNALDNVQARRYTDARCLWYSKPLLESGTTGTESNHDVILPFRTKTYNDDDEPVTNAIAMCTLRAAPYLPLHCIEYAKQLLFNDFFDFGPTQYENFCKDKAGWFASLAELSMEEQENALKIVSSMATLQQTKGTVDFSSCVQYAFDMLMAVFRNQVLDAIAAGDKAEAEGAKYWTGTKRRPTAVDFDPLDGQQLEFLYTASNMYAFVFQVKHVRDRDEFGALVLKLAEDGVLKQPAYAGSGDNVQEGEEEKKVDPDKLRKLREELEQMDSTKLVRAVPHDFEKDDDSNFHIDFLTAGTNLRAWNFGIKHSPRHTVKVTAGRIIPALATTTAMVCGLVDIEFCKLVLGLENLGASKFLSSYTNLGLGLENFNAFNPMAPVQNDTNLESFRSFTTWDKLEINEGGRSVGALVTDLEETYKMKIHSLSAETDYNPKGKGPKTIKLWADGDASDRPLSAIFKDLLASGATETERKPASERRAANDLKNLASDPPEGMTIEANPNDAFIFEIKLQGPAGSLYEGGLFLLEVKLPDEYPYKAPQLAFKTQIEHMNIEGGAPCPGLVGVSSWNKASELRGLLLQLVQLLKEPVPENTLRPELSSMDPEAYANHVRGATQSFATADQNFPRTGAGPEGGEQKQVEALQWHHDYAILRGSFANREGGEANLPRIKLGFGGAGKQTSARVFEPVDPEVEAKVLQVELSLDNDLELELTPESCYKPDAEHLKMWNVLECAAGLTADNAAVVRCKTQHGDMFETVVNTETMEHVCFEDPIMCTEESLLSLVEAQFTEGGRWTLSLGTREGIEGEKQSLFSTYSTTIQKDSPECLRTLMAYLQSRPVTCVYSGGGGGDPNLPSYQEPHKGFALRMPEDEVEDWTVLDDKGFKAVIPRPARALRVWDANTRDYVSIDPVMNGAPSTDQEVDQWYMDVIKKLKSSPYLGPEFIDNLVSHTGYEFDHNTSRPKDGTWRGEVKNRWTELARSTSN